MRLPAEQGPQEVAHLDAALERVVERHLGVDLVVALPPEPVLGQVAGVDEVRITQMSEVAA